MFREGQLWPPTVRPRLSIFSVAISFAGEDVAVVRRLVDLLERQLLPGEVFFDEFFGAEIYGANTRSRLAKVYRDQSTLVVPCLSPSYRKKIWTQIEGEVIRGRGQDLSVLAVQVSGKRGAADGWFGPQGDYPLAHKDPDGAAQIIVQRLRTLLGSSSAARHLQINPFAARALIDIFAGTPIEPERIRSAIPANVPRPASWSDEQDRIDWWLNQLREYDWTTLEAFLHALWGRIDSLLPQLNNWATANLGRAFLPPGAARATTDVVQVLTIPVPHLPEPRQYELCMYSISANQVRPQRNCGSHPLSALPEVFKANFSRAFSDVNAADYRVEFVLPVELLHGEPQRWQVRRGSSSAPLAAAHPTVVRSWERMVGDEGFLEGASAAVRWTQIGAGPCIAAWCQGPHDAVQRIEWRKKAALVLNSLEQSETGASRREILEEIVLSGAPIALWFNNVPPAWQLGQKAVLSPYFQDIATLPGKVREFRVINAGKLPDFDAVLLYEDASVPLPGLSRNSAEFNESALE